MYSTFQNLQYNFLKSNSFISSTSSGNNRRSCSNSGSGGGGGVIGGCGCGGINSSIRSKSSDRM